MTRSGPGGEGEHGKDCGGKAVAHHAEAETPPPANHWFILVPVLQPGAAVAGRLLCYSLVQQ